MKIFLTGESGILGSDIKRQLTEGGHEVNGYNSTNIQLGNFTDVIKKVRDFKPEIVIHCAAMTNVDLCEDDKNSAPANQCYRISKHVAGCRESGCKNGIYQ